MNLNLVQICGRLTKKPEVKQTKSGFLVASFSVATNKVWKDKDGKKNEEVEFHNVTAFGRTAENIERYFDKGDEIYIQGRLKTSSWEGKDGGKRYRTDIIAERFDFGQKSRNNQASRETHQDYNEDQGVDLDQSQSQEDEEIRVDDIPW